MLRICSKNKATKNGQPAELTQTYRFPFGRWEKFQSLCFSHLLTSISDKWKTMHSDTCANLYQKSKRKVFLVLLNVPIVEKYVEWKRIYPVLGQDKY